MDVKSHLRNLLTIVQLANCQEMQKLMVQMPQHTSGMKQDGVLAKLGRNLTAEAREGKLDPVIGRNKEIQRDIWNPLTPLPRTILF